MIVGLLIGKEKSTCCPGKNVREILDRPLVEYALIAAKYSHYIDRLFVSTDSSRIASIGEKYGAELIKRPPELATPDSLTEDVLTHAFQKMSERCDQAIDIVVLLFANSPTIPPGYIDKAVDILKRDASLDSCFTACKYNMFSPIRARKIDKDNLLQPYVDLAQFKRLSSIRDENIDCYFCDFAVQVIRDRCFKQMDQGIPPMKWMGKKAYALENDFGFDIDMEWQIPVIEYWLRTHGFTEDITPYKGGPKQ